MFNQSEVDSYDQHIWRRQRQLLSEYLSDLCRANKIAFANKWSKINYKNQKTVFFWPGDLLPDYEFFKQCNDQCAKNGSVLWIFTDNFIDLDDLNYVKFYSAPCLHALFGSFQDLPVVQKLKPSKLYNCFIQRVDATRQSWFYFLYLRGLLDRGWCSFLLKQLKSFSPLTGIDLFDLIHHKFGMNELPHFQQAYTILRSQVPFRNFEEIFDLTPYINDSKYSLVLETYATSSVSNAWFVGEKAIRALCFPTVPLLFMQTRAVHKLTTLGFEIPYHDQIDNMIWTDRQQKLLEILEQDSIDFDQKMLYHMCMHNRSVCATLQNQFHHPKFFDEFFTQVLAH